MSANPIDTSTAAATATDQVAGALTNPDMWQRIGIGAIGVALILVGTVVVLRQPVAQVVKGVAKAGTAAATDGASLLV
jgi:hypothetical protein